MKLFHLLLILHEGSRRPVVWNKQVNEINKAIRHQGQIFKKKKKEKRLKITKVPVHWSNTECNMLSISLHYRRSKMKADRYCKWRSNFCRLLACLCKCLGSKDLAVWCTFEFVFIFWINMTWSNHFGWFICLSLWGHL